MMLFHRKGKRRIFIRGDVQKRLINWHLVWYFKVGPCAIPTLFLFVAIVITM